MILHLTFLLFTSTLISPSTNDIITTPRTTITPTLPPLTYIKYEPEDIADFKQKAICFQKRMRNDKMTEKMENICGEEMLDSFCDNVFCEPLTSCPPGLTLVQNVLGHECCPACVQFLPDGAPCTTSGSLFAQCANGLFCDPSKGVCAVPPTQMACLADYHNRMLFKKRAESGSGFWVPAEKGPVALKIEYATEEMELPACSKTGEYQTKQRFKNKAYCVSPESGTPTFGVSDFGAAPKTTCHCSTAMFDKLNRIPASTKDEDRENVLDELYRKTTLHYADTHMKCTPTGDFHEMQCVNQTCFCLDQFSGTPLTTVDDWDEYKEKLDEEMEEKNAGIYYIGPDGKVVKDPAKITNERKMTEEEIEKYEEEEAKRKEEEKRKRGPRIPTKAVNSSAVVIFGAFRPLVCYDFKRAREVKSNFSKEVYMEECQMQIHTPMQMQKHFTIKGSRVKDLEPTTCGYDDRFARKQCLSDACLCSNPKGTSIGAYAVPLAKAQSQECRCALEEYYVKDEKLAFDQLKCDGQGDFSPIQCIGDRTCFCADANGSPISQEFSFKKVNEFIKTHAPGYDMGLICQAMRDSVKNTDTWAETDEICYWNEMKTYRSGEGCVRPNANNIISAYAGAGKSV